MEPVDYSGGGGIGAFGVILWIIILAFYIICYWKVFTKAGKPGWAAIVPIYNIIVFLEIVGRPLWWIILMLIPFVNFIVAIILMIDFAKSYGKSTGFAIGLLLLGVIFLPILAFGDAEYQGPAAAQG